MIKPAQTLKHYSFTELNTAMKCGFWMQSVHKPTWRILPYTVFLSWVYIILQMYLPVIFFPLSESVQNTPGVTFCFTNKTHETQSFSSSERSAFLQLLMMEKTRLEDKDLYFDQYLGEKITKSFCLFVFKGRGLSLKGMSPGRRNRWIFQPGAILLLAQKGKTHFRD